MRYKILIYLTFLLALKTFSAEVNFDSLRTVYVGIVDDSAKIDFLINKLGYNYEPINLDSAHYYYDLAIQISSEKEKQDSKYTRLKANALRGLGAVELNRGDFKKALQLFEKAIESFTIVDRQEGIANSYIDIGITYYYQGLYNLSLKAYLQALDIFRTLRITNSIASTYGNMAVVLSTQEKYKEALKYYFDALEIVEGSTNIIAMAYIYNNIGSLYQTTKEYEKALDFFQKALPLLKEMNDKKGIGACYSNIGLMFKNTDNLDQAIQYFKRSLKIFEEIDDVVGKISVGGNMASVYNSFALSKSISRISKISYYQQAVKFSEEALLLAKERGILSEINKNSSHLMNAYKGLGLDSKALEYAVLYIETQDSLFQQEINKSLDEIIAKHELEKIQKEQEIDKQIIERHRQVNRKQKVIIVISIIAFVIVLVLLGLLIRFMKQRLLTYNLLAQRNEELNKANEEIVTQHGHLTELNKELQTKNEQIKKSQMKLIQSEKMASLGVLTAGIAHEINNPINFVFAGSNSLTRDFQDIKEVVRALEMVDQENITAEQKLMKIRGAMKDFEFDQAVEASEQTIKDIKLGAARAAEIVDGLRGFSRGETDDWIMYDLHKAIDGVLILLKNSYKGRIEITKEYDENLPQIESRGGQINQVIMNLLSNAIDAIEMKGSISITTKKTNSKVCIAISDSGKGIPSDVKSKMFDPFFTTKDVGKGTGLGLSISFGIILEHKGTIDVLSKEGEGSEFIVTLPIKQERI
ncbi:MAG: tetratricopeptide repeat protein [Salinivirgaceae bacterium]|nr:tetratricopeptide repeat protein [Salinivirgaceae bacterium]MDD4746798.1 tetratricopeptide repeat protein [Salinivirgaceae bacterium]